MERDTALLLVASLLFVYWAVGLPLALLYLNYSARQLPWILQAYLLSAPLTGSALVLAAGYIPLRRTVLQGPAALARLPASLLGPALIGTLAGQGLVSAGLRLAASIPLHEAWKNVSVGLPIAFLYGCVVYFSLTFRLAPLLEARADEAAPTGERPVVSLFTKIWAGMLTQAAVVATILGLMSHSSSQRLLEYHLSELLERRLAAFREGWIPLLEFTGEERFGIIREDEVTYYRGPPGGERELLQVLDWTQTDQGTGIMREDTARVVGWRRMRGVTYVVAVIPISAYDAPLWATLRSTLLVTGFSIVLAVTLSWFLSSNLTRSLRVLTRVAGQVRRTWPAMSEGEACAAPIPYRYTDDEIGLLSRELTSLLQDLRRAQGRLGRSNLRLSKSLDERTRRVKQLDTLYNVSRAVSSKLHLEEVLDEFLVRVQDILGADVCVVLMLVRGHLLPRACRGVSPSLEPFSADAGIAGRALSAGSPIYEEPAAGDDPLVVWAGQAHLRHLVCVPMVVRDTAVGVLVAGHRSAAPQITSHLELLASLAQQAAVAVTNAQLFDERDLVSRLLHHALKPPASLPRESFQFASLYVPSRQLSGDYTDLLSLPGGRFALVIADVAGKGPEAAVQALRAKYLVRCHASHGASPHEILTLLNRQLEESEDDCRMITLFCGVVDPQAGTLRYAVAGHEPPLLKIGDGRPEMLPCDGLAAGVLPDYAYPELTVCFPPGSWLLLYTDGVTEARSPQRDFFGLEPLLEHLDRAEPAGDPQELVESIYQDVLEFSRGDLVDDVTLLLVCRAP